MHPVQRCADCREVAALGRSLAAVGGRLEALLVAAASQGPDQEALSSATILTGPLLPSPIGGFVITAITYPWLPMTVLAAEAVLLFNKWQSLIASELMQVRIR